MPPLPPSQRQFKSDGDAGGGAQPAEWGASRADPSKLRRQWSLKRSRTPVPRRIASRLLTVIQRFGAFRWCIVGGWHGVPVLDVILID